MARPKTEPKAHKPPIGITLFCVMEHLYYVPGHAGPMKEFVVFEGVLERFHQGGFTDMALRGKNADGYMAVAHRKVSDIGKTVFYTATEAALLAKTMTEDYEHRWAALERWGDVPLRRPWASILNEN